MSRINYQSHECNVLGIWLSVVLSTSLVCNVQKSNVNQLWTEPTSRRKIRTSSASSRSSEGTGRILVFFPYFVAYLQKATLELYDAPQVDSPAYQTTSYITLAFTLALSIRHLLAPSGIIIGYQTLDRLIPES